LLLLRISTCSGLSGVLFFPRFVPLTVFPRVTPSLQPSAVPPAFKPAQFFPDNPSDLFLSRVFLFLDQRMWPPFVPESFWNNRSLGSPSSGRIFSVTPRFSGVGLVSNQIFLAPFPGGNLGSHAFFNPWSHSRFSMAAFSFSADMHVPQYPFQSPREPNGVTLIPP